MVKRLIIDYLTSEGYVLYDNGTIDNIELLESVIQITESDESGYYKDVHTVQLIELLAWVYSKVETR